MFNYKPHGTSTSSDWLHRVMSLLCVCVCVRSINNSHILKLDDFTEKLHLTGQSYSVLVVCVLFFLYAFVALFDIFGVLSEMFDTVSLFLPPFAMLLSPKTSNKATKAL